jgi:hypothetical protein
MMSVFVLDDSKERLRKFRSAIPSAHMAETVDEAKEVLSRDEHWEIAFLDHDLGGEVMVDTSEYNTGTTLVRWLIEQGIKIDTVVVHSLNDTAAMGMVMDLRRAGYHAQRVPFTNLRL